MTRMCLDPRKRPMIRLRSSGLLRPEDRLAWCLNRAGHDAERKGVTLLRAAFRCLAAIGLLVTACAARAQLPADDLMDDLGRLTYDARSAGMGGAALAVPDLASAPVENAATLALRRQPRLSLNYFGDSYPAGPFGAAGFFLAATPEKAALPHHFDRLRGYAQRTGGAGTYGEITVLGTVGFGSWRLFGTKGAIGHARIVATNAGGTERLTLQGAGAEYETLGGAYGWSLSGETWMGASVREVRFYRADVAFTADRDGSGAITVDDTNTRIVRGLEWAVDLSVYHRVSHDVTLGAVVRHLNAPTFSTNDGSTRWTVHPSLDVGVAYQKPGGRSLYALDVRNLFGTDGGRPIVRAGWEYAFSDDGRWRGRLGLRDGRPSFGVGWRGGHGAVDLAFGPNPTERLALTASFEL